MASTPSVARLKSAPTGTVTSDCKERCLDPSVSRWMANSSAPKVTVTM